MGTNLYKLNMRGMRLFSKMSRVAQGPTQSPVYWVPAAVFSRVNLPGREADHSHPSVQ